MRSKIGVSMVSFLFLAVTPLPGPIPVDRVAAAQISLCHSPSLEAENGSLATPLTVAAHRVDGEPGRPRAQGLQTNAMRKTSGAPPDPYRDQQHQAAVTIQVKQAGTLRPPANLNEQEAAVTPGTYQWLLDPTSGWRRYTWNLTPAGGEPAQVVEITYDGSAFQAKSSGTGLSAVVDQASFFFRWEYEQAVRTQLMRPAGQLQASDLAEVTSLALPPHLTSVTELCHLKNLTDLVLEEGTAYPQRFLLEAAAQVPGLRRLTLTGPSALAADPDLEPALGFPYRVETPSGVYLGDRGMNMAQLIQYAYTLEATTLPELERDTGLRPTDRKPVFLIYGDEDTWNANTQNSPYWGFYTAREHRIYMAHWRTPESVNSLLMSHELFHWLAWEEGKVDLPTWLNEGLAHMISWRIEQGSEGWSNPYVRREWLRVAANPTRVVPELSRHTDQDEYTITAAAHLLQTRGRSALVPFFQRTRAGTAFADAFQEAFGVNVRGFEAEYRQQVAEIRRGR